MAGAPRYGFGLAQRLDAAVARVVAIVLLVLQHAWRLTCGLCGHDMVLHFEPARLSLRCLRCGARTPGWTIDVRPRPRAPLHLVPRRTPDTGTRRAA